MSHSKKTSKFCLFVGGSHSVSQMWENSREPTWGLPALVREPIRPIPKSSPLRSKLPPFSDISAVPLTKWQVIRNQHFDKQQNREVLEGHDVCFFNTPFKRKSHFLISPSNWSQWLASLCHLLSRNETHISQKSDSETVFRTTTPPYVGFFSRPGLTNRAHEVFTGEKEVHAILQVITCREIPPIFPLRLFGGQWNVVLKKE